MADGVIVEKCVCVCEKKYDRKFISVNQLSFVASKKSLKSDEKYYLYLYILYLYL